MKKIICLFIALAMCLSIAMPVFATEANDFVPSITYKPEPEVVPVKDENGEDAAAVIRNANGDVVDYVEVACLEFTPIADVKGEGNDDVEKLLLDVYKGLNDGSLAIPYEKFDKNLNPADMVVRDLFDIRWVGDENRVLEGNTIDITFDLGVVAEAEIFVATFDETTKEWSPIVKTVNNGDGTVTCTFEHFCPVSFSMSLNGRTAPVDDAQAANLLPWIIILPLAVIAFVVIVVVKNKKKA